jgi:CubicO group peptidase (beta-lactamase class C family)
VELGGFAEPAFARVRDRFAACFQDRPGADGPDLGAAVAVVVDGQLVVDLWGGWRDAAHTRPWASDTLTWMFSCRKTLDALAVHVLVDRGLVDYDDPVSRFWPEFAQAGKAAVTLRHVLSHQTGLPTVPEVEPPVTFAKMTAAIAAAAPQWEPGTDLGYSGTIDPILQEVVHRVVGEPLESWFRREVTDPVGVEVFLELPKAQLGRLANAIRRDGSEWRVPLWWPENAYATARSLARLFGLLARDDGSVLSPTTLARSLEVQVEGVDRINGHRRAYRLGWRKPVGNNDVQIGSDGFGSPGGFGSVVWADPEHRLGFAFLRNLCVDQQAEYRADELLGEAIRAAAS